MNKIKIVLLLIGLITFGCSKKADPFAKDKSNVHELSQEKMVQVGISYSTKTPINDSSMNSFRAYLTDKRDEIISDFQNSLYRDMTFISYAIDITDSAVFRLDNKNFGMIKVTLTAHGADNSASGNNVYLIDLTNTTSDVFQTGFFLPECGVADLNIKSVGKFCVGSRTYYLIKRDETISACCGASQDEKTKLLLFDSNTFSTKVGEITTFHKNYYNDFCGTSKPTETTRTDLYTLDNDLVLISEMSTDKNRKISFDTTYLSIDKKIKN